MSVKLQYRPTLTWGGGEGSWRVCFTCDFVVESLPKPFFLLIQYIYPVCCTLGFLDNFPFLPSVAVCIRQFQPGQFQVFWWESCVRVMSMGAEGLRSHSVCCPRINHAGVNFFQAVSGTYYSRCWPACKMLFKKINLALLRQRHRPTCSLIAQGHILFSALLCVKETTTFHWSAHIKV